MSRPLFSIAIVTRNRVKSVFHAIESALAQGRRDAEIVVVDNASTDGTTEAIREYCLARGVANVVVVRLPHNVGCAPGRNHAYANCRGRYIVNLDDDGWLGENVIDGLEALFAQDAHIGIIAMRWAYPPPAPIDGSALSDGLADVVRFAGGVCAFTREMLDATGGFPSDYFLHGEENYLALRALDTHYRILSAPHLLVWHPWRGGSAGVPDGHYHLCRNSLLTIARLYPGAALLKHLPMTVVSALRFAVGRRRILPTIRAILAVLTMLPGTLMRRSPVKRETLDRFLSQRTLVRFQSQPLRVQLVAADTDRVPTWLDHLRTDPRFEVTVADRTLWAALAMGDVLLLPRADRWLDRLRRLRLSRCARQRHLHVIDMHRLELTLSTGTALDVAGYVLRAAQVCVESKCSLHDLAYAGDGAENHDRAGPSPMPKSRGLG